MHSENIARLTNYLTAASRPLVIAFSGGVDSSVLVATAVRENARFTAVTVVHQATSETDIARSREAGERMGFTPRFIHLDIHAIPRFTENPPDRCYFCKIEMMKAISDLAGRIYDNPLIMDGTNADDLRDGRPGIAALRELGIKSPLAELGITKKEVREMAKALGIPHNTPAQPCYATRIPHGERITDEKILMIAEAEALVREAGAEECRVRYIEPDTASIELAQDFTGDFPLQEISISLKRLGFGRVVLSEKTLKRR